MLQNPMTAPKNPTSNLERHTPIKKGRNQLYLPQGSPSLALCHGGME